ncbi:MAG: hypothetical protein RIF32_23275 [Leptospirales bacterium]|jgi:hypothetical protein
MADLDMRMIGKSARDALHIGLGLYNVVREQVGMLEKDVTETYVDLVTRGAAEQSGTAVQLRGLLDEGLEKIDRIRESGHPELSREFSEV